MGYVQLGYINIFHYYVYVYEAYCNMIIKLSCYPEKGQHIHLSLFWLDCTFLSCWACYIHIVFLKQREYGIFNYYHNSEKMLGIYIYVCIYIYVFYLFQDDYNTHTCVHACMHTYLPTYLPTYIHTYIHAYDVHTYVRFPAI